MNGQQMQKSRVLIIIAVLLFIFAAKANAQTITKTDSSLIIEVKQIGYISETGDALTNVISFTQIEMPDSLIKHHYLDTVYIYLPDTTGPYVPPPDTTIEFTRGMYIEEGGERRIIQNATTKVTGDVKIWGTFKVPESGYRSVVIEKLQPGEIRFWLDDEQVIVNPENDYNYLRRDFTKGFNSFRISYVGGPGQLKFELIKQDGGQWAAVNEWEFWTAMDTTSEPVEPPSPVIDTTEFGINVDWDAVTKNIDGDPIAGVTYRVRYWSNGFLREIPVSGTFVSIDLPFKGTWSVYVIAKYKNMMSDPSETVSITLE